MRPTPIDRLEEVATTETAPVVTVLRSDLTLLVAFTRAVQARHAANEACWGGSVAIGDTPDDELIPVQERFQVMLDAEREAEAAEEGAYRALLAEGQPTAA